MRLRRYPNLDTWYGVFSMGTYLSNVESYTHFLPSRIITPGSDGDVPLIVLLPDLLDWDSWKVPPLSVVDLLVVRFNFDFVGSEWMEFAVVNDDDLDLDPPDDDFDDFDDLDGNDDVAINISPPFILFLASALFCFFILSSCARAMYKYADILLKIIQKTRFLALLCTTVKN